MFDTCMGLTGCMRAVAWLAIQLSSAYHLAFCHLFQHSLLHYAVVGLNFPEQ